MEWYASFDLDRETNISFAAPDWYSRKDPLAEGVTFGWGSGSTHVNFIVTADRPMSAAAVAIDRFEAIRSSVGLPGEVVRFELLDYYHEGIRTGLLSGVGKAAEILDVGKGQLAHLADSDPEFPEMVAESRVGRLWLTWALEAYAAGREAKVEVAQGREP